MSNAQEAARIGARWGGLWMLYSRSSHQPLHRCKRLCGCAKVFSASALTSLGSPHSHMLVLGRGSPKTFSLSRALPLSSLSQFISALTQVPDLGPGISLQLAETRFGCVGSSDTSRSEQAAGSLRNSWSLLQEFIAISLATRIFKVISFETIAWSKSRRHSNA